jgi:hypothetical protein
MAQSRLSSEHFRTSSAHHVISLGNRPNPCTTRVADGGATISVVCLLCLRCGRVSHATTGETGQRKRPSRTTTSRSTGPRLTTTTAAGPAVPAAAAAPCCRRMGGGAQWAAVAEATVASTAFGQRTGQPRAEPCPGARSGCAPPPAARGASAACGMAWLAAVAWSGISARRTGWPRASTRNPSALAGER